jgi:hypothetical protein
MGHQLPHAADHPWRFLDFQFNIIVPLVIALFLFISVSLIILLTRSGHHLARLHNPRDAEIGCLRAWYALDLAIVGCQNQGLTSLIASDIKDSTLLPEEVAEVAS